MDKNGWILTAALGAAKKTIDSAYDLPALSDNLDYIHLMCYDYHGSWDAKVGANAPLKSEEENDALTVVSKNIHVTFMFYNWFLYR